VWGRGGSGVGRKQASLTSKHTTGYPPSQGSRFAEWGPFSAGSKKRLQRHRTATDIKLVKLYILIDYSVVCFGAPSGEEDVMKYLVVALVVVCFQVDPVTASNWYVTPGGSGNVPTIQAAIKAAAHGGMFEIGGAGCGDQRGISAPPN
jgi:hypothetical protein